MKPSHTVDDRCSGDGICVEICPKDVLKLHEGRPRTIESAAIHCLFCGQCVMVCPNESLSMTGLEMDQLLPHEKIDHLSFDSLLSFLRSRRSVRLFSEKPVDRSLINQVLEAAALAPPAFPPHATEVVVLDQRKDLDALVRRLVDSYDRLLGIFSNPFGRLIIRLRRGKETYAALRDHVIQIIRWDNQRFRDREVDRYTYGAPAVLLFHSNRFVAGYQESTMVAATYAMLAAHALGLGATMLSIVPPALNHIAIDLRRSYGIEDTNTIVVALILGHRRYRFRRGIHRPLKSVRYPGDKNG